MEIERAKAHSVAQTLLNKQAQVEERRENAMRLKEQLAEERKQRNIEAAAKAGNKVQEQKNQDTDRYERKQALIREKEQIREAERLAKNKAKEEAFQRKLQEMEIKKEEFQRNLDLQKQQRIKELEERDEILRQQKIEKKK